MLVNGIAIHNIRAINKKTNNGEWQHFFSYPRLKIGDRYQDVIQLNKQQKEEIESAIQKEAKQYLLKNTPKISVEELNVIEGKFPLLAIADVIANDIGIKSVRLYQAKEGEKFAQLPQYQDADGKWKNLVQFDNSLFANPELTYRLEEAYKEKIAETQLMLEQQEKKTCR